MSKGFSSVDQGKGPQSTASSPGRLIGGGEAAQKAITIPRESSFNRLRKPRISRERQCNVELVPSEGGVQQPRSGHDASEKCG